VEYDEKDKSGKVTKYWGWCKGQIMAYRKNAGYLVKFADIIEHLWKCCCRVVGLDRRFKE
jgi:hypothetical protein